MLRPDATAFLLVFGVAVGMAEIVLPASDLECDQTGVAFYRTSGGL
jgi:hypothetical protein